MAENRLWATYSWWAVWLEQMGGLPQQHREQLRRAFDLGSKTLTIYDIGWHHTRDRRICLLPHLPLQWQISNNYRPHTATATRTELESNEQRGII